MLSPPSQGDSEFPSDVHIHVDTDYSEKGKATSALNAVSGPPAHGQTTPSPVEETQMHHDDIQ